MPSDVAAQITSQSQPDLKPIVGQILADEVISIGEVTATKIGRSAGTATAGVFRVTGQASTQNEDTEWSAVVKALGEPEIKREYREEDPLRELEVYRSGVFAEGCGGVRSARCYAIQTRDDLQLLWLEDLSDAPQPPWEADHFLNTARHLGQFNGHWPEQALPQWDWLNQVDFRTKLTGHTHLQAVFERFSTLQDHPLMQAFAPPSAVSEFMRLWEQCDELLIQAEGSPKGVCHLDCHPKNLFPISNSSGERYTIGIDWVKVGIDYLGVDIGHLLASPMSWLEVTATEARTLCDPIFNAYVSGLADAGWSGNEDAVRLTYLTRVALEARRNTSLILRSIERADWLELMERFLGHPINDICSRYHANREFYSTCKEEALQLAQRL